MDETCHINLAINGILRDIDTLRGKPTPNTALIKEKIEALTKCLMDNPDLDIPNNVFLGVSNSTRLLVIAGGGFAVALSNTVLEELLKKFDNERN